MVPESTDLKAQACSLIVKLVHIVRLPGKCKTSIIIEGFHARRAYIAFLTDFNFFSGSS